MNIFQLLYYVLRFFEAVIFVRIILSWIKIDPAYPAVQIIYKITEPVLEPIRKNLPIQGFGFDFSPVIVLILIEILGSLFLRRAYAGY